MYKWKIDVGCSTMFPFRVMVKRGFWSGWEFVNSFKTLQEAIDYIETMSTLPVLYKPQL